MDPRISFSNDFVVSKQAIKHENIYREAPVSSDFEFSVKNYSMISADQAFFKGMLLPLSSEGSKKVTLRDELLNDDDSPKWSKSISRWKERLGLKRGASKKDKNKSDHEFAPRSVANHKGTSFGQGETTVNKDIMLSQELFCEGGVSCKRSQVSSQIISKKDKVSRFWDDKQYKRWGGCITLSRY